ncbi:sigma factor, partial [Acinetobacter baumannii]
MKSNEKNFIKRLQRQKEDALEFVVDTYLPLIKGITHKVLLPIQNDGLIEECINDIFLSIWNNANKFHGEPNDFKKWIAAIAKFKAIDYYRKATKKVEII